MWLSKQNKRYFWAGIGAEFKSLASELHDVESEEDGDIFLLKMHLENDEDLNAFLPAQRERMKHHIATLVRDSERHKRTLIRLSRVLERYWKEMSES
jgi:hypothetical protein